jgi:chaperonin GroES
LTETETLDLIPLRDKIIIEKFQVVNETELESGIVLLGDGRNDDLAYGRALAVGDGLISLSGEVRKPACRVGDEVVYNAFDGTMIHYKSKEYLILTEDQIYAVIRTSKEDV